MSNPLLRDTVIHAVVGYGPTTFCGKTGAGIDSYLYLPSTEITCPACVMALAFLCEGDYGWGWDDAAQ